MRNPVAGGHLGPAVPLLDGRASIALLALFGVIGCGGSSPGELSSLRIDRLVVSERASPEAPCSSSLDSPTREAIRFDAGGPFGLTLTLQVSNPSSEDLVADRLWVRAACASDLEEPSSPAGALFACSSGERILDLATRVVVEAESAAIVEARVFSAEDTETLDSFFETAVAADDCCLEFGNDCRIALSRDPRTLGRDSPCGRFVEALGSGEDPPGESTIWRYRTFATFDGEHFARTQQNVSRLTDRDRPAWSASIDLAVESEAGRGDPARSGAFRAEVGVCRACGGTTTCMDR